MGLLLPLFPFLHPWVWSSPGRFLLVVHGSGPALGSLGRLPVLPFHVRVLPGSLRLLQSSGVRSPSRVQSLLHGMPPLLCFGLHPCFPASQCFLWRPWASSRVLAWAPHMLSSCWDKWLLAAFLAWLLAPLVISADQPPSRVSVEVGPRASAGCSLSLFPLLLFP